jgi:hypothetical protein
MGQDNECNNKRISNIEQGISNDEVFPLPYQLQHVTFFVRYSIFLKNPGQAFFLNYRPQKDWLNTRASADTILPRGFASFPLCRWRRP